MDKKVFIIAEVGINHNSNLKKAIAYVEVAKRIGADAVKFQAFWHWPDLRQYELSRDEFRLIFAYAKKIGIDCFATPFSIEAIDFLHGIGQTTWKVPSGMITNIPYLDCLRNLPEPKRFILSTGMSNLTEIETAYGALGLHDNICYLHCTTAYPAKFEDVNLKAMVSMFSFCFRLDVGLSDHTPGIEIPIAAVALGASVIEKHITFNNLSDGPDHKASLEVSEFEKMIKAIRNVEKAMGSPVKKATETELKHRDQIRARMSGDPITFTGYKDGIANYTPKV